MKGRNVPGGFVNPAERTLPDQAAFGLATAEAAIQATHGRSALGLSHQGGNANSAFGLIASAVSDLKKNGRLRESGAPSPHLIRRCS
jgi:hypothetical protein